MFLFCDFWMLQCASELWWHVGLNCVWMCGSVWLRWCKYVVVVLIVVVPLILARCVWVETLVITTVRDPAFNSRLRTLSLTLYRPLGIFFLQLLWFPTFAFSIYNAKSSQLGSAVLANQHPVSKKVMLLKNKNTSKTILHLMFMICTMWMSILFFSENLNTFCGKQLCHIFILFTAVCKLFL